MTRANRWIGVILTGLLGAGCGETSPATAPAGPSFAKGVAQSPTNSGPIVFRVNGQYWVITLDLAHQLVGFHFDIANPPSYPGLYEGCGANNLGDNTDFQFVFPKSEQFHELIHQLDAHVAVYDIRGLTDWFSTIFTCGFLADRSRRLASGTMQFTFTDNDIILTGPGGDAYGWSAQGQLQSPSGQAIQFVEAMRFALRPDGTFAPTLQMIKLTPDLRP